jgi:hypothetical protein
MPVACEFYWRPETQAELRKLAAEYIVQAAEIEDAESLSYINMPR